MEKLQELIKSHSLPEDMAARIRDEFGTIFTDLEAAQKEAESLVVITGDEPDAATAAAAQKAVAKMRIAVEKLRTELKAPYLRMGQAIDGIAKSLATAIEPLETKLKTLAATKTRLLAEAKEKLIESRKMQLAAIGFTGTVDGIGDLNEQVWQMILDGHAAQIKLEKEANERAEAERQAEEQRQANERAEAARIAKLGQSRREALLLLGCDVPATDLGVLSEGEYQSKHQSAAEAKEARDRQALMIDRRINDLRRLGATLFESDGIWTLGNAMISDSSVRDLNRDWEEVLVKFSAEANRLDEEKTINEAKMRIAITRQSQLRAFGTNATIEELVDLTDDQFAAQLQYAEAAFKVKQEEDLKLKMLEKSRVDALAVYGATGSDLASLDDDQWAECLAAAKKAHESSLSEQDRIKEIVDALTSVGNGIDPAKFSPKNRKKLEAAQAFVRNAIASLNS